MAQSRRANTAKRALMAETAAGASSRSQLRNTGLCFALWNSRWGACRTAKKARVEDLGHQTKSVNGNGQNAPLPVAAPVAASPTQSAFPPIADYAFLSDCEVNCLIAPSGRVEWMCLPRPDSPSVFAAILDRAAGSFRFGPSGVAVPAGRRYLPGTLVLETTWRTRTGWMIVRDALCIGPWYH